MSRYRIEAFVNMGRPVGAVESTLKWAPYLVTNNPLDFETREAAETVAARVPLANPRDIMHDLDCRPRRVRVVEVPCPNDVTIQLRPDGRHEAFIAGELIAKPSPYRSSMRGGRITPWRVINAETKRVDVSDLT